MFPLEPQAGLPAGSEEGMREVGTPDPSYMVLYIYICFYIYMYICICIGICICIFIHTPMKDHNMGYFIPY